jgi:hypothetical protein
MIEAIMMWESKGFRICIIPQQDKGKWLWVAGVYIGNERKADWVDCDNGLPRAAYTTYPEALKASIDYCENYKVKKKK